MISFPKNLVRMGCAEKAQNPSDFGVKLTNVCEFAALNRIAFSSAFVFERRPVSLVKISIFARTYPTQSGSQWE